MALTPRSVFRRFVTDGVSSSGKHKPSKDEIIQLLNTLLGVSRGGWVVAATKSALDGITPENSTDGGVVLDDATASNNGYYQRSGSTWVRERGFPDTFAQLVDIAGTANAVTAGVSAGVSPADISLFQFTPESSNTGAMTLSIAGGTVKPLVAFDGTALAAGYVQAGAPVLFYDDGEGNYRLFLDHRFQLLSAETLAARDTAVEARGKSEEWAEKPEDEEVEPGRYSALHHAAKSADSAAAAGQIVLTDVKDFGLIVDSYADAETLLPSLPEGQNVQVTADETLGNARVAYSVISSALSIVEIGSISTPTALFASTKTYLGPVGQILSAGNHRYAIADPGASDHHRTNAGGVKFYVFSSFGADGTVFDADAFGALGEADDQPTLQAAIDVIEANGGGTLRLAQNVNVATPLQVTGSRVRIDGYGVRSENDGPVKITKASGFTGDAAVIVGNGTDTVTGFEASHIFVDGNSQEGDGWIFQKISTLTLDEVMSQYNEGWGMVFDGTWITKATGCSTRFNGVSEVGGGGVLLRCDIRAVSNFWALSWVSNQNNNHNMLWTANDADAHSRPVGIYFYGGILELPQDGEDTTALVEIQACDRSAFFGVHFPQEIDVAAPSIILGSDSAIHNIDGLAFNSCYFQHNEAGAFAVVTKDNIDNVTFVCPIDSTITSKFLDATLTTTGKIMIIGGDVDPSLITDPNGVVSALGGFGVQIGLVYGTGGGQLLIDPRKASTTVKVASRDASGTERSFNLGTGTDRNLLTLNDIFLRSIPQASAPTNPNTGTLAIADRVNWDPASVGSGTAYVVWYNGSAWRRINEQ
jgi:hypothetical protein